MGDLVDYYGTECPHCIKMMPLVKKLEKELGVKVERKEVWHNTKNDAEMKAIPEFEQCGGVPFFYNKKTKKVICGAASYAKLKAWAQGK